MNGMHEVKKQLQENLISIKNASFDDKSTCDKVRRGWNDAIEKRQSELRDLYNNGVIEDWVECRTLMENDTLVEDELCSYLLFWLDSIDWSNTEEVAHLCKFVNVLSSSDVHIKAVAFAKHAQVLGNKLEELIKVENFKILDVNGFVHSRDYASVLMQLMELYFYHTDYSRDPSKQIGAMLIYDFVKAFPDIHSNLIASIIVDHPDPIEEFAKIINFSIKNRYDAMLSNITSDMFSYYAEASDYEYKNAFNIVKKCFDLEKNFTDEDMSFFIEKLILSSLSLYFKSKEKAVEDVKHCIEAVKLKKFKELKKSYEKKLNEIESNYDKVLEQEWTLALKRVAVSKVTYKTIDFLIKKYPSNEKVAILKALLKDADGFKNKTKLFDINNMPRIIFKDFGFKLMVIEELMYKQEILKPKFTLEAFAAEYTKKEINVQSSEPIDEVKKFYKNLDIPLELLKEVKELYQDSGLSGGAEVLYNIFPYWDPGCGDEVEKIKTIAMEDLKLLPNLKKVKGFENSHISKAFEKALKNSGIVIETEE